MLVVHDGSCLAGRPLLERPLQSGFYRIFFVWTFRRRVTINFGTTFSFCAEAHLLNGIEDVLVNVVLRVDGEGVACGLVVVFEEEVLERHRVLFLEGHDHMVAEAKEHQLRQDGGKVDQDFMTGVYILLYDSPDCLQTADATQVGCTVATTTLEAFLSQMKVSSVPEPSQ